MIRIKVRIRISWVINKDYMWIKNTIRIKVMIRISWVINKDYMWINPLVPGDFFSRISSPKMVETCIP